MGRVWVGVTDELRDVLRESLRDTPILPVMLSVREVFKFSWRLTGKVTLADETKFTSKTSESDTPAVFVSVSVSEISMVSDGVTECVTVGIDDKVVTKLSVIDMDELREMDDVKVAVMLSVGERE